MSVSPTINAALAIAGRIESGQIEPHSGAIQIWRQVAESGQRDINELGAFVGLASQWHDDPEHHVELADDIRTAAKALLHRYARD